MGQGNVWNRFDFSHIENPEVRLPLMKPIQRIVIRTDIFGKRCYTSNRLFEHATKRHTIDNSGLNSKSDDSTRVLVHHDQHPMRSQCNGFASHQINAPQTVLHVANKLEPRWSTTICYWLVVLRQDPANDILINTSAERQIDLLGDSRAAPGRIPPFHFNNGANHVCVWTFWSWLRAAFWRKQQPVFALN